MEATCLSETVFTSNCIMSSMVRPQCEHKPSKQLTNQLHTADSSQYLENKKFTVFYGTSRFITVLTVPYCVDCTLPYVSVLIQINPVQDPHQFLHYPPICSYAFQDFGPSCSSHSPNAVCLLFGQFSEPCFGKIDSGTWFSLSTSFSSCQCCSSIALCSYRDTWAWPGNLQTKQYPVGCWEPWDRNVTLLV